MLINHRTAQLGVVNQKRPEVWQSYLVPQLQQEDIGKLSLDIGNQLLRDVAFEHTISPENMNITMSIGDHKLIDPTKVSQSYESLQVTMSIGDHKLIDTTKVGYGEEDVGSVSLSVGDHKLYVWGVRAEVLDEDNFKLSLAIGDHKLYEEQS